MSDARAAVTVRLLPSSPSVVRFEVQVPALEVAPLREGSQVVRLALDGYENVGPPREAVLPERIVAVAVPPTGEVSVRATGSMADVREGVRLARMPIIPRGRSADEPEMIAAAEELATRDEPAPARPSSSAGVRARLVSVGWLRNQRIARIAITPADYDAAAGHLSLDRQVEVEVSIGGGGSVDLGGRAAEDPDPFEAVYREALVNYTQGRAWRRTASAARPRGALALPFAAMRNASVVPDTSIYAGRDWIKLAIDSTGFYKVRFSQLLNLPPFGGSRTVRLDSLRLFTWPGIPVLPEDSYCDSCDYREVAMGFVEQNGGNGIFDVNNEYLYFFALGASDWASLYDAARPDTVFINHPYETRNYCYLTIATDAQPVGGTPRRITTASGAVGTPVGGEITPTTFDCRLHFELDTQYWPDAWPNPAFRSNLFWEKWFWQTLAQPGTNTFSVQEQAPGVDVSQPSRLRMRCWGVTDLAGKSIGISDHYLDVGFNGLTFPRRQWENLWAQTYDTTLVGLVQQTNRFSIAVPSITDPNPTYNSQRIDDTALAWFDLFYARRFEPVADRLVFDSPAAAGTYIYDIGPFTLPTSQPPRVFDVTDPLAPIEILGGDYTADGAGGFRLKFKQAQTGLRRYRVIADGSPVSYVALLPSANVFMAPSSSLNNLREAPAPGVAGADYLVIYYDGFQAAAESLAVWRKQRLPLHGRTPPYETAAIPISALYDQFSGGRTDPGAIRNFLRAAFFNWSQPPKFVTLLGDASFDFKNLKGVTPAGQPGALVPSYESGYVDFLQRQYATDDWMLNVNDPRVVIPDFFGGRIPAGDAASALTFVRDKLLPYERNAPLGEWRNRVLLVADDNMQGPKVDFLRWEHVRQTAVLDAHTPAHMDRVYVYLHTYPDGPNNTKPGAKADIIKAVNDGVVLWNYIGHGSPFKIADESVFLDSDAGTLTNAARLPLFVAASCDVGKYDDPTVQSLGERLVMNAGGGCVAVISATELAFSYENSELNRILYDRMFLRDTLAISPTFGRYYVTMSEGLIEAKILSGGSLNNQKYQVMGDAATQPNLPHLWVELALEDANGNPLDTLSRGSTVHFKGRVLDQPGGTLQPFDGAAGVLIEDSAPIDTTFACNLCTRTAYPFRVAPMFRGDARVTGGILSGNFVVPLDAILGPRARLRGYGQGAETGTASAIDAAGSVRFVLASGTPPTGDDEGPKIALSFTGGSTSVRPDAQLRVDLSDASGILITGHSSQNGIIVTVDGNSNTRVDITSTFRYAANSYQTGTASFRLPGLAAGPHTIKVTASDNLTSGINAAQHRSSATIDFEVAEVPVLQVRRAFLFPNPTRSGGAGSGGQFVIDAPGDSVNVLVNLYSVSGRLIRTLKSFGGQGQVQIPWDGLDRGGEPLANGTYLFRVQANTRDELGASSARSRALGEGRFVIVGR